MPGPQFPREEPAGWRRLVPTIVILILFCLSVLVLAEEIRNLVFSPFLPALNWSRDQENAAAAQAISAVLQVVSTGLILFFSWHQIDSARKDAEKARKATSRATQEAAVAQGKALREAQRQAKNDIRPVLVFHSLTLHVDYAYAMDLTVQNYGRGPSLHLKFALDDSIGLLRIAHFAPRALISGESMNLRIEVVGDPMSFQALLDQQPVLGGFMVQLARIAALSKDIDGEEWEQGTHIMWHVPEQKFILFNDWFDFRPIVP